MKIHGKEILDINFRSLTLGFPRSTKGCYSLHKRCVVFEIKNNFGDLLSIILFRMSKAQVPIVVGGVIGGAVVTYFLLSKNSSGTKTIEYEVKKTPGNKNNSNKKYQIFHLLLLFRLFRKKLNLVFLNNFHRLLP